MSFALGLLMVSSVRYRSFKDFDLRHRRSFFQLVVIVAMLALAAVRPEITLALIFGYYALWGPLREGISLIKRWTQKPRIEVSDEVESRR